MSKNTVYSVLEYVLLVFIGVYPYIHRKLCGRTTKSGAEIICKKKQVKIFGWDFQNLINPFNDIIILRVKRCFWLVTNTVLLLNQGIIKSITKNI